MKRREVSEKEKKILSYVAMGLIAFAIIVSRFDDSDDQKEKSKQGTSESTITVENIVETEVIEETKDETTEGGTKQYVELEGRGDSDEGRSEPQYIGITGFVAIRDGYSIDDTPIEEWVWEVPIYEKDKQFWVNCGSVSHKTEVLVLEQYLEHRGYGHYDGTLFVERTDTKEQFYINVWDFVTYPYWLMDDIYEAAKNGELIAEFNQQSDYYPVTKGGYKAEIEDGALVLITGLTGMYPNETPDYRTNQLEATVLSGWKEGAKSSTIFINVEDLKIIY